MSKTEFMKGDTYFFHYPESQKFECAYYNPDADAGGQIGMMWLPYELITQAKEAWHRGKNFFDFLAENAYLELIDKGDPQFETLLEDFSDPTDLFCKGDTTHTMILLCREVEKSLTGQTKPDSREISHYDDFSILDMGDHLSALTPDGMFAVRETARIPAGQFENMSGDDLLAEGYRLGGDYDWSSKLEDGTAYCFWRNINPARGYNKEESTAKVDKEAEFRFLMAFARERDFAGDSVEREQLRALWTSYCLHYNLDVDTVEYDAGITVLWERVIDGVDILGSSDEFHDIDSFDLYMGAHLS